MLLKNVLKKAAVMVGLDIDFDDENAAQDRDVDLLVKCAAVVFGEIAAEYLPFICEEDIPFAAGDGAFYANFSHPPVNIVSVKSAGVNVGYAVFPDRVVVKGAAGNSLTFRYVYSPPEVFEIDSDLTVNPALTERTAALGIAAEYALVNGMFNESILYDRRYKDSLRNAVRKRGEIRVKARKFI
jgi:hypothetical protein